MAGRRSCSESRPGTASGGIDRHGYDRRPFPGWPLPNVWLGTSIESERYAFRADHLRATPATVRFLSLEPLLGPLPSLTLDGIDWVIVGAESGRGARPMVLDWVRPIRDTCIEKDIPFFFKQKATDAGRKISLPALDGRIWDQMPAQDRERVRSQDVDPAVSAQVV